jgi:hypothetical protein
VTNEEKAQQEKLTAIHIAVENELIELRDMGVQLIYGNRFPANGLVVREKDGSPSAIIRIGTRNAIAMILKESAKYDLEHPEIKEAMTCTSHEMPTPT